MPTRFDSLPMELNLMIWSDYLGEADPNVILFLERTLPMQILDLILKDTILANIRVDLEMHHKYRRRSSVRIATLWCKRVRELHQLHGLPMRRRPLR